MIYSARALDDDLTRAAGKLDLFAGVLQKNMDIPIRTPLQTSINVLRGLK
jgi:hypothetical protein